MDEHTPSQIDINQADPESLTALPGIGPQLAKRIIAARPFENIADLAQVHGISARDLERLRSLVTVGATDAAANDEADAQIPVEDPQAAEQTVPEAETVADEEPEEQTPDASMEPASEEIQPEAVETAAAREAIEAAKPPEESRATEGTDEPGEPAEEESEAAEETEEDETSPAEAVPAPLREKRYLSRGAALWMVFVGSVLAMALAIAITLGVLASVNRGRLTYASPAQVAELQHALNGLGEQAATLEADLEGLRARLDNLEALSGRVNDLEGEISEANEEIGALQTELAAAQAQYEQLNAEIEALKTQSSRFDGFLQGLYNLLSDLYPDTQEQ